MPFPVRLLSVDEDVAIQTRPHWTYLVVQLGSFVTGLSAVVVVTIVVEGFPLPAIVVIGAMAGLSAVALGIRLVRWAGTAYLVTDRRIVYWKGVPRLRGIELDLGLVEDIEVVQSFWGRLLGVGTLAVRSTIGGHVRHFPFVPRPSGVREEVLRVQRTVHRERPVAASAYPEVPGGEEPAGSPVDIPDQILKLYELVELGILSEAEFEAKKRDLLGRL